MFIYKHKPCNNEKMIMRKQCERRGEHPRTYMCRNCGAYLFVNNIGLVQYYNSLGIQISNWKEEVEEIEINNN